MSCPPPSPEVCPQVCPPPPPPPPCHVKPVMKCLHHAQTVRKLWEVALLCAVAGSCVYFFVGMPRKAAYREFYASIFNAETSYDSIINVLSMSTINVLCAEYSVQITHIRRAEFEDWGDEMARKGLFQSVPKESLKDNQHLKKK